MKRTNIYLEEAQVTRLGDLSRARGISRAELVRRLVDAAVGPGPAENLADDLAAINDSFGVLRDEGDFLSRGPDERARHLARISRR